MTKIRNIITAIIFAVAIVLTFQGCTEEKEAEQTVEDGTVALENVCVDIGIDGNGYYGLMGDCELTYYNGEITAIYVNDPVLLAFKVSDQYEGGVCTMSGAEMAELMEMLEDLRQIYADNEELQAAVVQIIELLEMHPAVTGAST